MIAGLWPWSWTARYPNRPAAGLTLDGGTPEELAEAELNGRQIRNLTRLARIVHPGGEVTLSQMRAVLGHGCA